MATKDSLIFNPDSTIVGINLCACAGDSGAPLWLTKNGKFFLIGIYHGLSNIIDTNKIMRVAAFLDRKKILKIKQIVDAEAIND